MDVVTYVLSRKYTDKSIKGISGTLAGKNCTIASIEQVEGGNLVTFEWYSDEEESQTSTMFVQDGVLGEDAIAPTYDPTQTYNEGDLVVYENELYRLGANTTTGEFNPNDWDNVSIVELLNEKTDASDLATVATSGSYNDLLNRPTIDSALSDSSENAVQNKVVAANISSIYGDIADAYDTTKNYKHGDFVIYNHNFYSCIEPTTGTWKNADWKQVTIAELLEDIKILLNPLIKDIDIATVAELTKNNEIVDILNFGDQLTVNWAYGNTNYDMPLNFCHFEVAKDANDNDVNVSDFESHYVLPFDLVYDDFEAIVALDENQTLTAGDYYFKIINDSWGNNNNKYICFTLESDLEPPYQIRKKSGSYNAAIEDCTLGIYTSGADRIGTALAFTVETTQPSSGTDLGQTDGTGYCNHWHCVALGYNRWKYSAIRQFLNSDATAGNWWTQQHKWDVMPAYATTKNGFLYGLSASVKQYLVETKVYTSRNTAFNSGDIPLGGMDETLDKVFLISLEQSYIEPQITGEGEYWEYYKNLLGTNAPVSRSDTYPLLIKYDIGGKTTARSRWLRSAYRGYPRGAWVVSTSGGVYDYGVNAGLRCAPCLHIGISN